VPSPGRPARCAPGNGAAPCSPGLRDKIEQVTESDRPDEPGQGQPPSEPHSASALPPHFWHGADPWQTWIRDTELAARSRQFPVPAWMRPTPGEHRWPATVSIIAAIVLELLLPPRLETPLPQALLPSLEGALLVGLAVANPVRIEKHGAFVRAASIALIFLITAANLTSGVLLIRAILEERAGSAAGPLLASGASIWATNVIAFALWYWEFDRGGPLKRAQGSSRPPDLMFPQMASPQLAPPEWEPRFVDYLYLAFTNATAFSPTDVMPLARWAKLTMLVQSALSLAIGALVIARAVNILRT
jgi:uncharacterized membrane protein